jgi:hypothetical protein
MHEVRPSISSPVDDGAQLFQRVLFPPTTLFLHLEPHVDRLIDQLLEVSASLPRLQYTAFWQIPLNRMVQHHAPISEGDWIWRIYDALLNRATTPLVTRPVDSPSAFIGSSSSPALCLVDRTYGRILCWWRAMSIGRRTDSGRTHPNAADWTNESILIFLTLLRRYGVTHDERGHDFVRGLVLHSTPEQVAWWVSLPSNVHTDWLCRPVESKMNLLQFSIAFVMQSGRDGAKVTRDVIRAQVDVWTDTHWPHIRRALESQVIRDLVPTIIEYLTPPPGRHFPSL